MAAASKFSGCSGRSLRAVVDLDALGERTVTLDCDVLEADGGTRTLSITGGVDCVGRCPRRAVCGAGVSPAPTECRRDACTTTRLPLLDAVAAVSVGIVDGQPVLDLDYAEDAAAAVDMNVVMTGGGRFIEVQGTGEEATFTEDELVAMLQLARGGIRDLLAAQRGGAGRGLAALKSKQSTWNRVDSPRTY